ncbi:MAG: helix-turn-helix transcriptional regulator [Coriobacteriales bacterium]|nr:helix-turn-helix transcriptional regulator [Coriobacteriales bacterium]
MKDLYAGLFGARGLFSITGLGLLLTWIYGLLLGDTSFYFWFHMGFGCSLVVVAIVYRNRTKFVCNRALSWVCVFVMSSVPLFLTFPQLLTSAFSVGFGLLSGAGAAYLFSLWFYLYCTFDAKPAVNLVLLCMVFSAFIRLVLVLLLNIWPLLVYITLLLLPVGSLILMLKTASLLKYRFKQPSRQSGTRHTHPEATVAVESRGMIGASATRSSPSRNAWPALIALTLELFFYGLVFGVLHNVIADWSASTGAHILGQIFRLVLPLVLLLWVNAHGDNTRHRVLVMRALLLSTAFFALVLVFFGKAVDIVAPAIILAARNLVATLLYLTMFRVLRDIRNPYVVYSLGRATYELALVGGLFLLSQAGIAETITGLPANMIYFIVACVFLLLLNSFSRTTSSLRREITVDKKCIGATSFDEQCLEIGKRFRLTEREIEVMQFLCSGRSKKQIAGKLYLSEDTVRYHTKQIYRKLNVHSKQQLLDRIGLK